MGYRILDLPASIMARVEERNESGYLCWIWTGATNNGYGRYYQDGKLLYAHRIVYESLIGPIPEGMQIDHLCRRTLCVNPAHLELVTSRENQRRGIKGVLTTHCPKGHPYDEQNTLYRGNGHRRCRTCHNERETARRIAKTVA